MLNDKVQKHILSLLEQCKFRQLYGTYFMDDFFWIIKGSSVLSGEYYDKDEFFTKVIDRFNAVLLLGWKMYILNSYINDDVLIVEMRGEVKAKNGQGYIMGIVGFSHLNMEKLLNLLHIMIHYWWIKH